MDTLSPSKDLVGVSLGLKDEFSHIAAEHRPAAHGGQVYHVVTLIISLGFKCQIIDNSKGLY